MLSSDLNSVPHASFVVLLLISISVRQEIFHAQLPKMPKEYIVRLVFDRRHRSIVLCKNGTPIGGITYRPFEAQKFGEIAFCAVLGNAQASFSLAQEQCTVPSSETRAVLH